MKRSKLGGSSLLLDAPSFSSSSSKELLDWFDAAFLGEFNAAPKAVVRDIKEGYGHLRFNSSIIGTGVVVGGRSFGHGFGVHAVSEVEVSLPSPVKRFSAFAGIDVNVQNHGQGSAIFAVCANDKELFRSGVLKNGDAPLPVSVDLGGAKTFTLKALDSGAGTNWAHCDWADPKVVLEDGREVWLDSCGLSSDAPFTFKLDGVSSREFLHKWKRVVSAKPERDGRFDFEIVYFDPFSGLEVHCDASRFADSPTVEWLLRFKNSGSKDSPLIEAVRPLDLSVGVCDGAVVLHHALGSSCRDDDFLPFASSLKVPKDELSIAPEGGRGSSRALPFFNLDCGSYGFVVAVGWSGQWDLKALREGPAATLSAGQTACSFRLRPGEEVRSPSIALLQWSSCDWLGGCNLFRQFVLKRHTPKIDGKIPVPSLAEITWFVFNQGNEVTEANQLDFIPYVKKSGMEAFWIDAGWFEGGWPNGAGSWVPKKEAFPRGLRPVGDACHDANLKFVLWFEPERVTENSRVYKEHPEWVMRLKPGNSTKGCAGMLFKLGDPDARKWLADLLSKCVSDWGIDVLRIDFNIDPLAFWTDADEPGRIGISEIRYVESLYLLWDELLARHPGLTIDNCASGGRRIDLETIGRSYPLWQSDTQCCGFEMPVSNQVQNASLSLYVPLHAGGFWGFDKYAFRSMLTMGGAHCPDIPRDEKGLAAAREAIDEVKSLRPFQLGDFYPIFEIAHREDQWFGWQFDRPDLGEGGLTLFRRKNSLYKSAEVFLRGLDASATYEVLNVDDGSKTSKSGEELMKKGLPVEILEKPGSVLLRYKRK